MTEKEIINDINKLIQEIIDLLDVDNLISFKNELEKIYIVMKCTNELKEKLGDEDHD